jgi:hypothetical protein
MVRLLYMSVLVAVRIPDDVIQQVDAKGKRSRVILDALDLYLNSAPVERIDEQTKTIHFKTRIPTSVKAGSVAIGLTRREHDAQTCKVYGCLMCKQAKANE